MLPYKAFVMYMMVFFYSKSYGISHYKYGTLYNIYTITNNYNHTSHKYIIYYTCITNMFYKCTVIHFTSWLQLIDKH